MEVAHHQSWRESPAQEDAFRKEYLSGLAARVIAAVPPNRWLR